MTAAAPQPAIEAVGLTKSLAGRPVLRGLDLSISAGRVVALTGVNGAGKTTLLRCLSGLVRPDSGEIRWLGRPAAKCPAERRLVGMLGHETSLYPHLTLLENLLFAARMYGLPLPCDVARQWLEKIGLDAWAERLAGKVSRGMRQRVALARALLHSPRILLLDEPFSGLDRESAAWLVDLLQQQGRSGTAVCFVAHEEDKLRRAADEVLELRGGRTLSTDLASAGPTPSSLARAA